MTAGGVQYPSLSSGGGDVGAGNSKRVAFIVALQYKMNHALIRHALFAILPEAHAWRLHLDMFDHAKAKTAEPVNMPVCNRLALVVADVILDIENQPAKIGRASCRERV